jgi:very-short-patch-repair endonuclease
MSGSAREPGADPDIDERFGEGGWNDGPSGPSSCAVAEPDHRIAVEAKGQHTAFSRAQANAAGLTNGMLRRRVQSGFLEHPVPNVFRSKLGGESVLDELWAALLDLGDGARVSFTTGAAIHCFDGFVLARPFHITVPRGRYYEREGVRLHTSLVLPPVDRTNVDGLAVTSPTRTIIDLAAMVPAKRLGVAIDSAIRDHLTTEAVIRERLEAMRGRGRRGARKLLGVLDGEVARGGHSFLERRFLELAREARLPPPRCQRVTDDRTGRIGRVDCAWDDELVVVELLGYRWHRTKRQLQADVERANRLQLVGWIVLQFTYEDVVGRPAYVLDQVQEALRARPRQDR